MFIFEIQRTEFTCMQQPLVQFNGLGSMAAEFGIRSLTAHCGSQEKGKITQGMCGWWSCEAFHLCGLAYGRLHSPRLPLEERTWQTTSGHFICSKSWKVPHMLTLISQHSGDSNSQHEIQNNKPFCQASSSSCLNIVNKKASVMILSSPVQIMVFYTEWLQVTPFN